MCNFYLTRSSKVSTVVTFGVLPALSILSAVWDTPGLIVVTRTIPFKHNIIVKQSQFMSLKLIDVMFTWLTKNDSNDGSGEVINHRTQTNPARHLRVQRCHSFTNKARSYYYLFILQRTCLTHLTMPTKNVNQCKLHCNWVTLQQKSSVATVSLQKFGSALV